MPVLGDKASQLVVGLVRAEANSGIASELRIILNEGKSSFSLSLPDLGYSEDFPSFSKAIAFVDNLDADKASQAEFAKAEQVTRLEERKTAIEARIAALTA